MAEMTDFLGGEGTILKAFADAALPPETEHLLRAFFDKRPRP
jgi:hypothetical protein